MLPPDVVFADGLPNVSRVADYLEYYATHTPGSPALVFQGLEISYGELAARVDGCARRLLGAGIAHGDIIATLSNPRPEFVITFLAAAKIGAIWLGLNPKYTVNELDYVLCDARPGLVFSVAAAGERDYASELREISRKSDSGWAVIVVEPDEDGLNKSLEIHAKACSQGELERASARVSPGDPALIIYTSGTTGNPKGAILPQAGLARCARIQHRYWGAFTGKTRMINPFPINHLACVGDVWCLILASGGAMVLMEQFDPAVYLQYVDRHGITVIGLIPTMFLMLLENPAWRETSFQTVQRMVWGGAAAPAGLIRQLTEITSHLSGAYGSTETVGQVCFVPDGATVEQLADTIGPPVPDYEVRIATEDGAPVARGDEGEIQVRGEFVFLGYLNRPEATAAAFTADGWLKTGDAGVERPDGFYRITGRLKEMFKSGGYNVYPREIEVCLENHPDVELAAVISVPDALYNEVGTAFCQVRPGANLTEEELERHCRQQLANYKVPKQIHLVRKLPMLPVGKVDKKQLRDSIQTGA